MRRAAFVAEPDDLGGLRGTVVQDDAFAQLLEGQFGRASAQGRVVRLGKAEARMGHGQGEVPVIGHEQHAGRVVVQAPHRV
ncbi:hypothetical protein D3C72_1947100 [compost metagenome]